MPKLSTFICNANLEIECVISDELVISSHIGSNNIRNVFSSTANKGLDMILEMAHARQPIVNWKLPTNNADLPDHLFFSMAVWLDRLIIRISEHKIPSFFFDITNETDPVFRPDFIVENEKDQEQLDTFTQLNNELTALQRELHKKNLNLEKINLKLKELATTDPLTGIFNRREIMDRANEELERARREKRFFGLAEIDLDNFKEINDTFGHHVGDIAIKAIASMMASSTRRYDAAGRIGGDEFLIFFSLISKGQLRPILDRLFGKIQGLRITIEDGHMIEPRASIGAVCFSALQHGDIQMDDLLIKADQALYQSKRSGGNQITLLDCDQ